MKKLLLTITFFAVGYFIQAQIIITEAPNPQPSNSSVLLEFGTQAKGIILPSVNTATEAVGGTFIFNSDKKVVQVNENGTWINLTDENQGVVNPHVPAGTTDERGEVIMGAASTTKPGVLVLESTTQAMVLPKVSDPHLTMPSPIAGTMVYDTTSDMLAVYDGANWSYWK